MGDDKKDKATWKDEDKAKPEGLPARKKTFWLEYFSSMHDKTFVGHFTFEKLTVRGMAQVGVKQAQLNGGMNSAALPVHADVYNMWLAHFEHSIARDEKGAFLAPEWFKPYDEIDDGLLEAIYEKIVDFENFFRASLGKQRESTPETSEAQRPEGLAETVVGSEVQAAANVG